MDATKEPKPGNAGETFKERYAAGKALRETCPRNAHGIWKAPRNRPVPPSTARFGEAR